jgi:hypothetical protein
MVCPYQSNIEVVTVMTCKHYEPDEDKVCIHYNEEDYGIAGYAKFCRHYGRLVYWKRDCPMSPLYNKPFPYVEIDKEYNTKW